MSAHCSRYPGCGCGPEVGTKCGLPEDHPIIAALKKDQPIKRNEKGYPLLPNGDIDWELTSKEKSAASVSEWAKIAGPKKRRRGSNYTPPKKRRK